ncbi:MMPL family transporter [Caldimonas sp. KR1-144]|uniref:MMPL family transporter n=1 Tax=Caldimonas sp. KR1-144 TaxID=3400911 RepID=UPI003C0F73CF
MSLSLSTSRRDRTTSWPALAWLLVVLVIAVHQWHWWRTPDALDTDVMALLPRDGGARHADRLSQQLAMSAARRLVVLVGADDAVGGAQAARIFEQAWREAAPELLPVPQVDAAQTVASLAPWRDRLLSEAQREQIRSGSPQALAEAALADLYLPGFLPRLGAWGDDPLNLGAAWWRERMLATPVQWRDGHAVVEADGRVWHVLLRELPGSAFALDGQVRQQAAIARAEAAAQALVPHTRVRAAGIPLFAEAAAQRASVEINVIGWGSLAAIAILMLLAFRSPLPLLTVALSLAVGCAVAVSATAWLFGQVHLITLVFGATLIGVAEDYGIHYWAARTSAPSETAPSLMKRLMPGMLLALLSTVAAYAVLGAAPFPGLRQMAAFSSIGLVAAFLTVVCWMPWLDSGAKQGALARAIGSSLLRWPRWTLPRTRRDWWFAGVGAALVIVAGAFGMARLSASDDVRQLQSAPAALIDAQREVQRLLRGPSPAQFILACAADADAVLAVEEAVRPHLAAQQSQGRLIGWQALSDWVPSAARQRENAAWVAAAETAVRTLAAAQLGDVARRVPLRAGEALTLEHFLSLPIGAPMRAQWLASGDRGACSAILLDAPTHAGIDALAVALADVPGAEMVDRPARISATLATYRVAMSWLLVAGFALVYAVLWHRFRAAAWRAWLPTLVATGLTLSVLGWMGEPFQLFNVLALIVLLGVGVDYGIFLVEHRGDPSAWLAVVLGAASTLLSFGLLGLSTTPALRAFGLTLALGLAFVWVLSPLLRPALPRSGH